MSSPSGPQGRESPQGSVGVAFPMAFSHFPARRWFRPAPAPGSSRSSDAAFGPGVEADGMKRTVDVLEGNTFVVSDERGDIDGSPAEAHGLFDRDTRYLSRWVLMIDGQR